MTAVLFCMAMIIEIVYVFMSPVPKELENKYLLIGTAFICAADFTYHTEYITIKMYVLALLGSVATLIFLISCAVGVITKCIDFADLFFSLYMALFQPLLTILLTRSYKGVYQKYIEDCEYDHIDIFASIGDIFLFRQLKNPQCLHYHPIN